MQAERTKSFTTARKSILESVKLQSLVAKCCKMKKIALCKFRRYQCITCRNLHHVLLSRKWCKLLHVIQKVYKICEICRAIFPSLILQHFATKLCNFTNFTMLFVAASCSDGFRSFCLDQNLVYGFDHPREIFSALAKFCSLRFKLSKFEYFRFLVKAFHPYKPICLLRTC